MKINKEYPYETGSLTQTLPRELKDKLNNEFQNITSDDNSSSNNAEPKKTRIYEPKPLTPQDPVYDEVMEQLSSRPVKPKYWFEEFGDYWSCSCGHINRGDVCTGCGLERDLLRQLFILHKPDDTASVLSERVSESRDRIDKEAEYSKASALQRESSSASDIDNIKPISVPAVQPPPQVTVTEDGDGNKKDADSKSVEVEVIQPTQIAVQAKSHKKRNIIIAIAAVLVLALAGAAYYVYTFIATPAKEYESAQAMMNSGKYEKAIEKFTALGDYEDSENLIRECYIGIGDRCLEAKEYDNALKAYRTAQDMDDTNEIKDKINLVKYQYVKDHASKGGDTFESYLAELKEMNYPGINAIYDKYYAWHMKIIANSSEDDLSTSQTTFSRFDTVFFHASLTGGEPDETISLYYTVTWPGGFKETQALDSRWKSGSKITAHFSYPIAFMGSEGNLTFKLYDSQSNEEMGSCTITFKN